MIGFLSTSRRPSRRAKLSARPRLASATYHTKDHTSCCLALVGFVSMDIRVTMAVMKRQYFIALDDANARSSVAKNSAGRLQHVRGANKFEANPHFGRQSSTLFCLQDFFSSEMGPNNGARSRLGCLDFRKTSREINRSALIVFSISRAATTN